MEAGSEPEGLGMEGTNGVSPGLSSKARNQEKTDVPAPAESENYWALKGLDEAQPLVRVIFTYSADSNADLS